MPETRGLEEEGESDSWKKAEDRRTGKRVLLAGIPKPEINSLERVEGRGNRRGRCLLALRKRAGAEGQRRLNIGE